jgi:hypothetical protein
MRGLWVIGKWLCDAGFHKAPAESTDRMFTAPGHRVIVHCERCGTPFPIIVVGQ